MDMFTEGLRQRRDRAKTQLDETSRLILEMRRSESSLIKIVEAADYLGSVDEVLSHNTKLTEECKALKESGDFIDTPVATTDESPSAAAGELDTNTQIGFVYSLIVRNPTMGQTPSEIRKAAAYFGREVSKSFPYSMLNKLKDRGKIREDGGRYFPKESSPKRR